MREIKTNVFVTGAAGFLGSHLVETLQNRGFSVTALVMKNEDQSFLKNLGVKIVVGDITNLNSKIIPDRSVIFHCAALTPGVKASKKQYFKINTEATLNLYHSAIERDAKLFVYISSNRANLSNRESKIYPYSDYGASKKKAEELLIKKNNLLPTLIIRPSGIYGPRMNLKSGFGRLFIQTRKKYIPVINKKNSKYQFSFVKNVVEGILQIYETGDYSIYNIADPPVHNFKTIVKKIQIELNPNSKIINFNYPLARTIGFLGDFISRLSGKEMPISSQKVNNIAGNEFDNCDKINQLGYKTKYSVEEGIKMTTQWLNRNNDEN
tara:strand:- start:798 stop:1766 length:969 start_codon:yes stop_codon:yes gene_type:complete